MTQRQLVVAYKALQEIMKREWPFRQAYGLMRLGRALEEAYTFQAEQENRLVGKYKGVVGPGGTVTFASAEARAAFEGELKELDNMDSELEFETVTLTVDENTRLTPAVIKDLDGFVTFREG